MGVDGFLQDTIETTSRALEKEIFKTPKSGPQEDREQAQRVIASFECFL
jgi:hypothetical protein